MKGLSILIVALIGAAAAPSAGAQSRNTPRVAFGTADLAKLRWLQGRWEGTALNQSPTYQVFRFANDSTVDITYYRDSLFTQQSGSGRVYLSVGRVYHTFGANRWAATRVDSAGVYFIPQTSAHNNFSWTYISPDAWTSTMRSGIGGHQRVIVYNMKRVPD